MQQEKRRRYLIGALLRERGDCPAGQHSPGACSPRAALTTPGRIPGATVLTWRCGTTATRCGSGGIPGRTGTPVPSEEKRHHGRAFRF